MEDQPSKLWNVALVLSLLLLAAVCYVKFEPLRSFVDTKCPWVKEQLTKHGVELPGVSGDKGQVTPVSADAAAQVSSSPSGALPASAANAGAAPAAAAVSKPKPKGAPLDLARLASDQSLWPKKVALKKDTTFPAVMNKKKVGELHVPAGTEVMLIQVRTDKLAVAYTPNGSMDNAGGAMIPPEETDVLDRANSGR